MMNTVPEQYLPQPAAQAVFGVTAMTFHRWRNNPEMGFPQPVKICGRNYFRAADLAKWQQARLTGAAQ